MEECPIAYYSNTATYECDDALSSKLVFFPILITCVVVLIIVLISKCITPPTSIPTALTAIYSPLELAIWIYVIALLGAEHK